MSGISKSTALEIFTNPRDLEIRIEQKSGGKYAVAISRGPSHNFKIMLSSQPFTEKLEGAVEVVKEILESIRSTITKELVDTKSVLSQHLNPDGKAISQSKVLNLDLINRIVSELRQHQIASTYKMHTIVG